MKQIRDLSARELRSIILNNLSSTKNEIKVWCASCGDDETGRKPLTASEIELTTLCYICDNCEKAMGV